MRDGGTYTGRKGRASRESGTARACIFDIQRFSLHDGPGIRTTVFFKGCPLRCAWCQNPESHRREPEIAFYEERCARCFTCRDVCPEDAILEDRDRRIDHDRCTTCGECTRVCPNGALRLIGRDWDAGALVSEVLKDSDYFADSGGGVTLSGGEPLVYPRFILAFFRAMRGDKVHTALETCGVFRWHDMERILPNTGLIYYDLKHMDPRAHREYTGADNRRILDNFLRLSRSFRNLQARMPVIPGFNDDAVNIGATAAFLKRAGRRSIHCLPYHNLGEAKIPRIRTSLRPLGIASRSGGELEQVKKLYKKDGIDAVIYD
jgi:pyruvate formate lyase activating enzyme